MSHGVYFSVLRGTVISRVQRDGARPHVVRGVYRYSTCSPLPDLAHIGGVRDRFLDTASRPSHCGVGRAYRAVGSATTQDTGVLEKA